MHSGPTIFFGLGWQVSRGVEVTNGPKTLTPIPKRFQNESRQSGPARRFGPEKYFQKPGLDGDPAQALTRGVPA
jgi:hypothetical protein